MRRTNRLRRIVVIVSGACVVLCAAHERAQAAFTDHGANVLGGLNVEARSASLADIDNDGDLDMFFQGGTGARQLLRNNLIGGDSLTFSNISGLLPPGLGPSWSAAWSDFNGDGLVDVFVGQSNLGGSGDVLRNNGAAGFSNESVATGLNDPGFHQNVAWADIDNDGRLDLLLAMEGPDEKHEIYLQGAGNAFSAVGAEVGFQAPVGIKAYGMAIGDTDGDGDLDIYISTCRGDNNIRNNFYQNMLTETGALGFVDIADSNGTQFMTNSYGAEFHDFDDDGDLDLFMVGADQQPSKIFRNDGGNMFTDIDAITGHALLTDTSGDLNGGRAVDYDNDGDLDLFFHDHRPMSGRSEARKLYRNDGNWEFTDVTALEGLAAPNEGSYDSAWGDIDRDGDQDLIATTDSNFAERVFLSDASTNGNHWLYVDLAGPAENTTGLGATLYATLGQGTPVERTLRREANANAGTFNQSDLPVHFGLGALDRIDTLRVEWPDGSVQRLFDISAHQYVTVTYAPELVGDFNADGRVDSADYAVWRDTLGQSGVGLAADGDSSGVIDAGDYDVWRTRYGATLTQLSATPSSSHGAAPEPSSMALAFLAVLLATTARRFD